MTGRTAVWGGLWLASLLIVTGCATTSERPSTTSVAPSTPSLYKRLGGRDGIRQVVDDFVTIATADPRIGARFKDMKPADLERLKTNVADQVCEATGGPCSYFGKDMKTAHAGLAVSDAEWSATFEDLVKALDKNKVPEKDRNELFSVLGPMKNDIVGR